MDYIYLPEADIELQEVNFNDLENINIIREREKDIQKLSSEINKVNEIFSDLGKIIIDQQDNIDTIESNTDDSLKETKKGLYQITRASKNQIKYNKCYLFIFFIIILLIIFILLMCIFTSN